MAFSPQGLAHILDDLRPDSASGALIVAFSGGVDSLVLLAALARLREEDAAGSVAALRAIHVNHQLHPDAGRWQERCREFAASLDVPFTAETVSIRDSATLGIEAAARAARYDVLYRQLAPGDILLTAHHADDQLETVLLALLRGSGVRGLAGMPGSRPAGQGWHQRPLLDFTRAELITWAREQGLAWSDDPANAQPRYSRSYLRQSVVPLLRNRWPAVAAVASRSAAHLAEASGLLDDLAQSDLAVVAAGEALQLPRLAELSTARRRNVLRFWIRQRGLPLPGTAKLLALEHDVLAARPDAQVRVTWDGVEVRRYRSRLYVFAPQPALPAEVLEWNWKEPLVLPGHRGELVMQQVRGAGLAVNRLPAQLDVGTHSTASRQRSLRKLLQGRHVLPWWRERLPLISAGDELVAIGDLWVDRGRLAGQGEEGVFIEWRGRPQVLAP